MKCTAIGSALDTCPDAFQAVGEDDMRHPFSCRSSFSSVTVALFEELGFVKVVFFLLALALLLALATHRCLSKRLVYWYRGCFWLAVSRSTAFGRRRCRATFLLDRPALDLNFDTTTTVLIVVVIFKHGVPNNILTAVVFELGRIKAVSRPTLLLLGRLGLFFLCLFGLEDLLDLCWQDDKLECRCL